MLNFHGVTRASFFCMVFFPFCFYSLEVHNGLGFRDKMGLEADRLGDILMHTMFESSFNHQPHQPYTPEKQRL